MSLRNLVAGLVLCLCGNALCLAGVTYEGVVRDDSGNPVEFANVTLQSLNDSTLIDGMVTDETGRFALTGNDGTRVFLRISAMGFEDRKIVEPIPIVGDIVLAPASYKLGEVVVKGARRWQG